MLKGSRPKKGEVAYFIRYALPTDALAHHDSAGRKTVAFGISVYAFDRDGRTIVRDSQGVDAWLDERLKALVTNGPITVDQQINLKKGEAYVYLAV